MRIREEGLIAMSEFARQRNALPSSSSRENSSRKVLDGVCQAVCISLSILSMAWLVRLLVVRDPVQGAWALQVILAVAAFMAGCWGAVHRYRVWTLPMRELLELLPRAQRGEIPIEQLSDVQGGPQPLVPLLQDMLRELRAQRGAIAELEMEMRQRVASRTDALERTIGSLRQQATRDALTGLFNRRFLDQYLTQCVQRHIKERKDLCVLMVDVDHFKLLNDTLGHAAGDDLLKAIGQLIRSAIRGEDVGFRCGGDEFVVLLPGSGVDAGRALADRLTSLVDLLTKTLKVPTRPALSIGLTTLADVEPRTPEALLQAADRSLYERKKARRGSREGLNTAGAGVQSPPLSRKAG
jgi:diguanylate cyclase (GGDEF)-like protein